MVFCDNCGAKLSPGAVFCEECGTRVASGTAHGKAVYCEECGSRILPGAAFCEECGTRVAPAPEPVPLSKQIKMASVKAVYCEECGTKLLPGACFCEECGTRVPNMDAPVQKQPEKGFLFDGVDENFLLFTKKDWASRWEKKARNATNYELGIILTNLSILAMQLRVPVARVEEVIRDYIAAAKERGVEYCMLRLDENKVLSGFSGNNRIIEVEETVDLLREVVDVARPKYLFILGNENVVDIMTWENEAEENDIDADVDSDLVYTVLDTTSPWEGQELNLAEALRVGRLPTTDRDFEGFQAYFENAKEGIGSLGKINTFGLSTISWEEESQYEYGRFRSVSEELNTSPETLDEDVKEMLSESEEEYNLLFFNLHGSSNHQYWLGERYRGEEETYLAVSPDVFTPYPVPFFLGVEACYGARYIGLPCESSTLKTAMRNKCLSFLGSSRVAMGGPSPEFRCHADIVVGEYLKQVASGETAGDAYIMSLQELVRKSKSELDCLTPDDIMTIAEFALYGDPSACKGRNRNNGMAKKMIKAIGGTPKGLRVPVPDVLKAAKMYLAEVSAEIEANVDAFAAKYLPVSQKDGMQMKSICSTEQVYRLQNANLFNKSYSYDAAFGKGLVSVYFDRNGKIRRVAISK